MHTRLWCVKVTVVFLLLCFALPPTTHADDVDLSDPSNYSLNIANGTVVVHHGDTVALPLDTELPVSASKPSGIFDVAGEIYFLPTGGDARERITDNVLGTLSVQNISFPHEGIYEVDFYEVHVYVSDAGWFQKLWAELLPTAQAFDENDYLTTMQFTVTEGDVLPAPSVPSCELTVTPETIVIGESATLSWTSTLMEEGHLSDGIGFVAPSGSVEVSPDATTTYSGEFFNFGTLTMVECEATLTVEEAPPEPEALNEKAAAHAIALVDQPDGYLWGGKGWDFLDGEFVNAATILSGYNYYNPDLGHVDSGIGVDCSGLVAWAYNLANDASVPFIRNFIKYEGAAGQATDAQSKPVDESELRPGDTLYFDGNGDSAIDHTAMYVGDQGDYDIVNASSPQVGIVREMYEEYSNAYGFEYVRRPTNAQVGSIIEVSSPVDLVVTDPDGNTIRPETAIETEREYINEIPGELYYSQSVQGHDGNPADIVYSPHFKKGEYVVKVVPDESAEPSDTYSLTFTAGDTTVAIAEDEPIDSIPQGGFAVTVADDETITVTERQPVTIRFSEEETTTKRGKTKMRLIGEVYKGETLLDTERLARITPKNWIYRWARRPLASVTGHSLSTDVALTPGETFRPSLLGRFLRFGDNRFSVDAPLLSALPNKRGWRDRLEKRVENQLLVVDLRKDEYVASGVILDLQNEGESVSGSLLVLEKERRNKYRVIEAQDFTDLEGGKHTFDLPEPGQLFGIYTKDSHPHIGIEIITSEAL